MTETPPLTTPDAARQPVAAIRRSGGLRAEVVPDDAWRAGLAAELTLLTLRKVRLSVTVTPTPEGLTLSGHVGATIQQPCIITLEPVTTRIEAPVLRTYLEEMPEPQGEEVEMPEDDSLEPLGAILDLGALLAEALALNLPLYPRAPGAELGTLTHTKAGVAPLTDEDVKPFAGLKDLKDQLRGPKE